MSPGMTDEACATIFGRFSGEPTSIHEEPDEDIHVVLADREECRRILKEELVSITCAYQLMHFVGADDPFAFLSQDPRKNGRNSGQSASNRKKREELFLLPFFFIS